MQNEFLIMVYPQLMRLLLLFILILVIRNLRVMAGRFRTIKGRTWIILSLVFFTALTVRLVFIPRTHYVYYDEYGHVNIAQNILYANGFCTCYAGSDASCRACYLEQRPPGYHAFLSTIFILFGDSEQVAFITNEVVDCAAAMLMFLLLFAIFNDVYLALAGCILFCFLPGHLKYSGSNVIEIFSTFSALAAMLALEIFMKTKKYSLFVLFLSILSYAVQTRPENFLLIVLFAYYIWMRMERPHVLLLSKRYLGPLVVFLFSLIPLAFFMYVMIGGETQYNALYTDFWRTVRNNFMTNFTTLFDDNYHLMLVFLLWLPGVVELWNRNKKYLLFLSSFMILFIFIYSFLPMTVVDTSRFGLIIAIPAVWLAVYGIKFITDNINKRKLISLLLLIVLLVSFLPARKYIYAKSRLENEYRFMLKVNGEIAPDAVIINQAPYMIIAALHKEAYNIQSFLSGEGLIDSERDIYLYKDSWWRQQESELEPLEETIGKEYIFVPVAEEGNLVFYRLVRRSGPESKDARDQ